MPLPLCHLRSNISRCQEISPPSNTSLPLSLLPSLGAGKCCFPAKSKAFISAFQSWE